MQKIAALFPLLLLLPVAISTSASDYDQDTKTPLTVSYCQLIKNPSVYAGQLIQVRAIYRRVFEVDRLEAPECCDGPLEAIWVESVGELGRASRREMKKMPVAGLAIGTFIGQFEAHGPYGHEGLAYKLMLFDVKKIERTAHFSPTKKPAWLPSNCEKTPKSSPMTQQQ